MLQFYEYYWLFPNYEYKPFQVALFSTRCGDPWRLGQPSRPSLAFLNERRKLHPSSPNHQCIIRTTSHYQMIDTLNELTIHHNYINMFKVHLWRNICQTMNNRTWMWLKMFKNSSWNKMHPELSSLHAGLVHHLPWPSLRFDRLTIGALAQILFGCRDGSLVSKSHSIS